MTKHRLRDEINADIDRFVDLKTEIMKVIDAVPDEVDRCVFERHFLKGKNYTVIGMEMKYNKDYAYKIIIKGSEKIQILENVLCSFMSIIINRSAGKENLLLNFGLKGERVRDYRLDSLEREKFIPHCPVCGREWLL